MKVSCRKAVSLVFGIVLISVLMSVQSLAATQTFTGIIGDAMCGAKHVMPGNDVSCTQGCISKGSKYALIVGEKVYVLDTTDKAVLATFEKRAGQKVTITGTEKEKTIAVTSVKAAQ